MGYENRVDDPIIPRFGDVFLDHDFVAGIVVAQQEYLEWLRDRGVRIYFVV